jgi:parallel beta-helix repeat protein
MDKRYMLDRTIIGILVLIIFSFEFSLVIHAGSSVVSTMDDGQKVLRNIWLVDDDGAGDFTTITGAISAANNNDIIEVYSGIYPEHVVVDKSLTFSGIAHDLGSGTDTGMPVVDSPVFDCFQVWVGDVTIQGFNITGGTTGVYILGGSNHKILNNTISLNGVGIWLNSTDSNLIIDNTVSFNNQYGIYLYPSNGNRIYRNHIFSNTVIGLWIVEGTQNTVVNNYFNNAQNAQDDGAGNIWSTSPMCGTNIIGGDFLGGNWWQDFPYWGLWGPIYNPNGRGIVILPAHAYNIPGTATSVDAHPLPGFEVGVLIAAFIVTLFLVRKREVRRK